ncbi:MAG TPA: thioredoxin [Candidatus Omnitrophota bacterium]|nr:thioredoxin [Candidatus Omnitrophota bacterium]HPD84222.1 thioredoxin [Candidatus Omnitrophota bacterium]HRZ03078.1 thioredoxin [Candidatus Omnitrophota bacterium]
MGLVHLTQKNFEEEVLKSKIPVLVDFWAEWCGPCRMIAPAVDQLAEEFSGKFKVAKVNVDEAQDLAMQYSVMSIPTLMIFKEGKVADMVVGALGKEQLAKKMKQNL